MGWITTHMHNVTFSLWPDLGGTGTYQTKWFVLFLMADWEITSGDLKWVSIPTKTVKCNLCRSSSIKSSMDPDMSTSWRAAMGKICQSPALKFAEPAMLSWPRHSEEILLLWVSRRSGRSAGSSPHWVFIRVFYCTKQDGTLFWSYNVSLTAWSDCCSRPTILAVREYTHQVINGIASTGNPDLPLHLRVGLVGYECKQSSPAREGATASPLSCLFVIVLP